MSNENYARIRDFVAKHLAVKSDKLHVETRLAEDLGLTGADAEEFLEAFSEEFGVDMAGFEFGKHFGPEATFDPIGFVRRWVFERRRLQFIPITLADLAHVIERHRWRQE